MLRSYTEADYAACINILESNVPRYFAPKDREEFRAFLTSSVGLYSVLEDHEGMIVGCGGIATRKQGQEGILTWGMISATRHRQGWGRRLALARFSQLCAIASVKCITLHTSQEAIGFYEKLGFHPVTFILDGYDVGLHRYDMELTIDEQFRQHLSVLLA